MTPTKNEPRDPDRALHRTEAARWIHAQTAGLTLANLLADSTRQLALERQFKIIGEVTAHVSAATLQQWPRIAWQRTKSFHNSITHEYFRVDYAQLLRTAQRIIPQLLSLRKALLLDFNQQFGPDAGI